MIELAGRGGTLTLEISEAVARCGSTGAAGQYTVSLQVVSDGAGNCGLALPCGASPTGVGFKVLGEVDAFTIALVADQAATLKVNYLDGTGSPYVRLFDPDGEPLEDGACQADDSRRAGQDRDLHGADQRLRRPGAARLPDRFL